MFFWFALGFFFGAISSILLGVVLIMWRFGGPENFIGEEEEIVGEIVTVPTNEIMQ